AGRDVTAEKSRLSKHGVEREQPAEGAPHQHPLGSVPFVVRLDERHQLFFEKSEKLRSITRAGIATLSRRRVVHSSQGIVVRIVTSISDADDYHLRYKFIVKQTAVNGVEQFEVPLPVKHIKDRIFLLLIL